MKMPKLTKILFFELSALCLAIQGSESFKFESKAVAYFPKITTKGSEQVRPYGFISFDLLSNSTSRVEVRLSQFEEGTGPYSYHIHTERVPESIVLPERDCLVAKAHLDPSERGENSTCTATSREDCQVGDVSTG